MAQDRANVLFSRIYNKILDSDWFSVGVQSQVSGDDFFVIAKLVNDIITQASKTEWWKI